MLAARYAKIDAAEYFAPRVAYYERLRGSSIAKMNGHPLKLARLRERKRARFPPQNGSKSHGACEQGVSVIRVKHLL